MIRCSSAYSICTNRPSFNEDEYNAIYEKVKEKVEKKGQVFSLLNIEDYCGMAGVMTDAKKLRTQIEKKYNAEHDPLPDGAKTYLEERWLELNYNFHDFGTTDSMPQIEKGNICEEGAIYLVGQRYNLAIEKNPNPAEGRGFLIGSYDVKYANVIRDIKVPETWKSFRSKTGIALVYYWQLIAYCLLHDCTSAYLDYVLMPYPEEMVPRIVKNYSEEEKLKFVQVQNAIRNLDPKDRIKTYKVEGDIQADIEFLESRLEKAEAYYDTLTYAKCMKMAA